MKESNMYKWVTGTKNPLAGECPHKCTYCSTHNLRKRYEACRTKYSGELRIEEKVIETGLWKDKTWFIVGQNDLFAKGVNPDFIREILAWCRKYDNTYLFQTKNPDGYFPWLEAFPKKTILCTTIETNRIYSQMGNTPDPLARAFSMQNITEFTKYVTIEPVMDFDLEDMAELIRWCGATQVNIGADSKNNHLPEPSKEKLLALIDRIKEFTTIARKSNLERILK